jgi:hypothetical protein
LSYLPIGPKNITQDFNEIDRLLTLLCFPYLNDIEDIKKWGIIENKTFIKYIDFWKLPNYYKSLYAHLLNKGIIIMPYHRY